MVITVAVVSVLALMPIKIVVAASIGWASHLILDAMSGGVQLWWPKKNRWVLGRYPVYGVMDRALMVGAMLVTVGCVLMRVSEESRVVPDHGQAAALTTTERR